MEQGEVALVDVLLATACLACRDYEAWREGRVAFLEDVLQCSPEEVRRLLQEIGARALAHGLRAEELSYAHWASGPRGPSKAELSPPAGGGLRRPMTDQLDLPLPFPSWRATCR